MTEVITQKDLSQFQKDELEQEEFDNIHTQLADQHDKVLDLQSQINDQDDLIRNLTTRFDTLLQSVECLLAQQNSGSESDY
jgi:DNA-directed RNA polymerase specialized sigma54-like protein